MANTCRQIVDSASVRRRRRRVFVLLPGLMNGESRDFGFVPQHRLVVERTTALMAALEAGAQTEERCQNSRDGLGDWDERRPECRCFLFAGHRVNDGLWHTVSVDARNLQVSLNLDSEPPAAIELWEQLEAKGAFNFGGRWICTLSESEVRPGVDTLRLWSRMRLFCASLSVSL